MKKIQHVTTLLAAFAASAILVATPVASTALASASPASSAVPPTPPAATAKDKATKGVAGNKGKMSAVPPTPCTSTCFMYSGGRASGGTYKGAIDDMGVYNPALKQTVTADFHTLGELAVQSADSKQIVEVGWNVDKAVNGDLKTHLFVYHWVNGAATCYNGCGWVDYATETTWYAGMDLTPYLNGQRNFMIQYSGGSWWVAVDPHNGTGYHWLGYFPGSLWTSPTYTQAGLVQVFGEVAAAQKPTCTDAGNGVVPSATNGAIMGSLNTLIGSTWTSTNLTGTFQDPTNGYTVYSVNGTTFRYGGGGSPQAVGC